MTGFMTAAMLMFYALFSSMRLNQKQQEWGKWLKLTKCRESDWRCAWRWENIQKCDKCLESRKKCEQNKKCAQRWKSMRKVEKIKV